MAMEREALDMAPGVDVDDGCHSPFAARQRLRMLSRHLNPPHVSAAAAAAAGAAGAALSGKVKLVVGANNFGGRLTDVAAALTAMRRHGVHELDVARAYVGGEAEVSVGVALAATAAGADAGAESPVAVTGGGPMLATKTHFNQLGFRRVKEDMAKSLAALGRDKVDIYYIHSPDGSATLTETLQAVNELHSEGKFDRLGISNFPAWQLMMIIQLSKERGWLLPSVYQGAYSVIQRHAEVELLPLCRAHGISYYAYSPLARGILTGKHAFDQPEAATHPFQAKYWAALPALQSLQRRCDTCSLGIREASLRWLRHHSALSAAAGDAVILGASSVEQLVENVRESDGGALPAELIAAMDGAHAALNPVGHFLEMQQAQVMQL